MSIDDEDFAGDPHEIEFTMSKSGKTVRGTVIKNDNGELDIRIPVSQFGDQSELEGILSEGEVEIVAVWTKIADRVIKHPLEEGAQLLAWVRVKMSDGKFAIKTDGSKRIAKTAIFSLGAIAAVSITRRAVQHYKSR
jgi:hypothetical protein